MKTARAEVHVVAAVIVDAQGRFLVARKRGTTMFMQAGGKIEPDEEPLAALVRELREELGVLVEPGNACWLGRFEAPAAHEPETTVVAEVYEVACADEPRAQAEIEEIAWLAPGEEDRFSLAPLTRLILERMKHASTL
ncbi:MAG: NUDIX hydrolase [Segniliparus sp.]|uniref:NUDIX hydrolase n=1 Tax=Segniliparus sp. TaxID=2804064 RepID=UPI003F3FB5C2